VTARITSVLHVVYEPRYSSMGIEIFGASLGGNFLTFLACKLIVVTRRRRLYKLLFDSMALWYLQTLEITEFPFLKITQLDIEMHSKFLTNRMHQIVQTEKHCGGLIST